MRGFLRSNRRCRRTMAVIAAASATVGAVGPAVGSDTWTFNGTASWSTISAWANLTPPSGIGEVAVFGLGTLTPTGQITVKLDSNRTMGELSFRNNNLGVPGGWLLDSEGGSTLRLEQFGSELPDVRAIAPGGDGTLAERIANLNAGLTGNQGFGKTGTGTAVLSGNNSGLSGSITLSEGILVLNHANALGSTTLLTQRTGQLAFRRDSAVNFSGTNISLQGDSTFGTGNSISTTGLYGTGSNQVHTLGNVTMTNYGVRTLGISGSNGYGLNIGVLTLNDGINFINEGGTGSIAGAGNNNNVTLTTGSGLVTIGTIAYSGPNAGTVNLGGVGTFAGDIAVTNGVLTTGGGSAALVYSGSRTATIGGAISTGGDVYVTGGTTGTVAGGDYQAGVGTLVAASGTLYPNQSVWVNGGTLMLGGGTVYHNVLGLTMGGATLTTGPVPAHVNTGAGTVLLGTNGIVINSSTQFDVLNTIANVTATAAGISGRLDLGGSQKSIAVHGNSTLTIGAIVSGAGAGIIKSGTGALVLNNANTFTGNIDILDGVVAGTVQLAGNPFGSGVQDVYLGGALRLNGLAGSGAGTIGSLLSKDTGMHSGLIVDATGGGTTTLHVGSFGGRMPGTRGTIKVVPMTGQLNTKEVVNLALGVPTPVEDMLPAWIAVQSSGVDTKLTFGSLSGTNVVGFNGYIGSGTTAIASAISTDVFDQTSGSGAIAGGGQTLFGLRIGPSASVTGASTLTLGTGGSGFGGLIMNGSAAMNTSTLTFGSDEGVIWSGGTDRNSISSNIRLGGDLTTGGAQELLLSGPIHLGGATRNISVTGGQVTIAADNALTNTGNIVKRGGGVLAIGGNNPGYSGSITIVGGTLQLGTSPTGDVGTAPIINNANVAIRRSDTATFTNSMAGSGDLWIDGTSTGLVTLTGSLSYTGRTNVQSGTLRINQNDRLPTGTALQVEGGASFNMFGNRQTVGGLSGDGTVVNGSTGSSNATLTVNGGGTFNGSLRNGASGIFALHKTGSGTLILGGNNVFNGGISITGGTLQLNSAGAGGSGNGNPAIVLDGGALALAHSDNMSNQTWTIKGTSTISVIGEQAVQLSANQEGAGGGPAIFLNSNSVTGAGTVVLALNGRTLHFGHRNPPTTFDSSTTALAQFSGTIKFADNNPPGSQLRFGVNGTNPGAQVQATLTTFDFGNGHLLLHFRNGTTNFNIGRVQGGTNTILEGHTSGGGRWTSYNFGFLGGDQTFHGQIRDMTTNGALGIVHLQKFGAGAVTLKNNLSFTGGITVHSGTLILASGANITNSNSITIHGGTLAIQNGATITSNGLIAWTNPGFATGGIDLSAFGAGGYATPAGLIYAGGGTVYGIANHSAGTIAPGAWVPGGTLTFASGLKLSGGNLDFDLTSGAVDVVGAGINDLVRVPTPGGLSINGGYVRLDFNAGSIGVNTGDYYPLMEVSGAIGGAGTSSLEARTQFHGSFDIVQGTGSLANTLGAKVMAVGGPTVDLIWNPISPETNFWAAGDFKNFKPVGGSGSLYFFSGDTVTFDDSTTIRTVRLTPALAPASITVNTDNEYFFTGLGFGSITGSTGITKNGSGTLWLAGQNSFTGGVTINGGTLVAADPFASFLITPRLQTAGGTVVFNNDSDFRMGPASPGTFAGPDGGVFVWNAGSHEFSIPSSNQPSAWNVDFHGVGTVVIRRPPQDNNNSNINFQAGDLASFFGTLKMNDLTDFAATSNQQSALRDGTIIRPQGGGNPSMILDMGGTNSFAGLQLQGANQTFTMGSLRGGPNTKLKPNGNNVNGTFNIAGVGPQYNSTFHGVFKAISGANTGPGGGVNDASIMLAHVVKSGSGSTLTLTQSQPYVGNTIVSGGTLALVGAQSSFLSSPTITVGSGGVLDISGLNGGAGGMTLLENQRLISTGDVVGGVVNAVTGSTVGGTRFAGLELADDSTFTPGSSIGTLTVDTLTMGATNFIVEMDAGGIDTVVVTQMDGLAIGATVPVQLVNTGVPAGTYTLLDYAGNPANYSGLATQFALNGDLGYTPTLHHNTGATRLDLILTNNVGQWFSSDSGAWDTPSEWTLDDLTASSVVPNSVKFGSFISTPVTISPAASGNSAVGVIFDTPAKVTIANTGSISIFPLAGADAVTVLQGHHLVSAPVQLGFNGRISVAAASSITFGGTVSTVGNAPLVKVGAGSATFTRLSLPGAAINVSAGLVTMSTKGSPNTVEGTNLADSISVAPGASLDLTNNALILDFTGADPGARLIDLRGTLADGRLFSSTAASNQSLGYRLNNISTEIDGSGTNGLGLGIVASFAGVAVDFSSVLVRVTYDGDSNLDGEVNVHDLYNLAINWQNANAVWAGGDFNYDGVVNKLDLGILAQNWHSGYGAPLPSGGLAAALAAAGIPMNAVPEPGSTALACLGTAGLLSRRRRR